MQDVESVPTLLRKQLFLLVGAAPAFVVVFVVLTNATRLFSAVTLPADDTASRLGFFAHWLLLPGLTLWAGIQYAGRRGWLPTAIDGTRETTVHSFEINLRYNTNTVEQVVGAAIAWSGLAIALPHDRLVLIPAMASLFFLGRITFWIGYLFHPLARAFGMVLTALPTLGAYVWLVWHWLST
jgi:hypothetical protein